MHKIPVGILGASGYAGRDLCALVQRHPRLELAFATANGRRGETAELSGPLKQIHVDPAPVVPGVYRTVTGAESLSFGLVAGAQLAGLKMFFGGYPITPASAILHHLSRLKEYGITTFQAEDEIAAICSAIGASYAGQLG